MVEDQLKGHVVEEVTCKKCRRQVGSVNGLIIAHLKPTSHLCDGISIEEAIYLSNQMAEEASKPEAVMAAIASEPCSFCDRTQTQVYPDGNARWYARGQARVCGQCIILMMESMVEDLESMIKDVPDVRKIETGNAC